MPYFRLRGVGFNDCWGVDDRTMYTFTATPLWVENGRDADKFRCQRDILVEVDGANNVVEKPRNEDGGTITHPSMNDGTMLPTDLSAKVVEETENKRRTPPTPESASKAVDSARKRGRRRAAAAEAASEAVDGMADEAVPTDTPNPEAVPPVEE